MLHRKIQRMNIAKGIEPEPPDSGNRSPRKVWTRCKALYNHSQGNQTILRDIRTELPDIEETI